MNFLPEQKEKLKKCADAALTLLYPHRCPLCDRVLAWEERSCPSCERQVVYEDEPRCMKCGRMLRQEAGHERTDVYCPDCMAHSHRYDYGYCLASYRSVAHSLYRLKYGGRREYAVWYADQMVRRFGREMLAARPEVLVPVPLHPARRAKRGYNQAEDIARELSRKLGIPMRTDLIVRQRNTPPMKQTDGEQKRRNNLKNAFQLRVNDVKYKRIMIIDDIYTSGSTVDAIAEEFRRAGVREIFFAAAAGTHR